MKHTGSRSTLAPASRPIDPALPPARRRSWTRAILAAAGAALLAAAARGNTITVTTTADVIHNLAGQCAQTGTGTCSLRDAILFANANSPGPHTVSFSGLSAGSHTITLTNANGSLDAIAVPMTINGTTHPDGRVEISGNLLVSGSPNGLTLNAKCTIQGMVINKFGGDGIFVGPSASTSLIQNNFLGTNFLGTSAAANNGNGLTVNATLVTVNSNVLSGNGQAGLDIEGNFLPTANGVSVTANMVGTDRFGVTAVGNGNHGIRIRIGANGNTIGGGNVVSGNTGHGIFIDGSAFPPAANVVSGNFIGTRIAGLLSLPNSLDGIRIDTSPANVIGPMNIISGNTGNGIGIFGASSDTNQVFTNLIGLDATAVIALSDANGGDGIRIQGGINTTVGGALGIASRNVISANGGWGVRIDGNASNTHGNVIEGNFIGTNLGGGDSNVMPNVLGGVLLSGSGSFDNTIGGVTTSRANTIAWNTGPGVRVGSADNDSVGHTLILTNSIHDNGQLGIDLGNTGVTPNDPGDVDAGAPNEFQNFPVISLALVSTANGKILLRGTQDSKQATNDLQFFVAVADPSGHGEGKTFLLDQPGTANGPFSFGPVSPPTAVNVGDPATSTASTADGTSEFSLNLPFVANQPPVANAGPNQNVLPGATVTLNGSASSDPDGLPNSTTIPNGSFTWAQTGGPAVALTNPTSAMPSFVASVAGTYVFSLVVNDGMDNSTNPASVTIVAAPLPTVSINNVSQAEGNAGTTPFNFTVTLSAASASTVTVDFATADATATVADGDYVAASGTVTFTPGQTTRPIVVNVNGDLKTEPNETFTVTLSNPSNASIGTGTGTGTIQNDDATPTIAINDVSQIEGNAGTSPFAFTVTLSNPTAQTVTVDFATANGTATAGSDYVTTSGTLTFLPGVTTQPLPVLVNGDVTPEANETFFINLSNPSNATISDAQGMGTILNDDGVPLLSINNVTQAEGNAGNTTFTFTVTLSAPSASTVTVDFATADGTATVADNDYAAASGTVTFLAGQTSQPVLITVKGDTKFEPNETFTVNLSNSANATISVPQGTGTITNDDAQPTISINNVTALEGNAGGTPFGFTVTLSNASSQTVTVDFATADATATIADGDYAAASGTVTFLPGQVTRPVTVTVNGDTKFEPSETFTVNLSNPSNATIAAPQGTGTITNDDSVPTISINDVSLNEGNAGTTPFSFTATLSNASSQTVTVNYATADGTATVAGGDYVAASGTLSFPPGVVSLPVIVSVNGDMAAEPDETFFVNLSAPSNATIADGQGMGTIVNDDGQPTLAINDVSQNEGNAGTTTFTFTVTLSAPSASTVTVNFATADGTATVGNSDYVAASGTVTFLPGQVSRPVAVTVNGDVTVEPNETFFVNLSAPSNATIADAQGLGTILNDDGVTISITNVAQNEGNAGSAPFTFNVTLSAASASTVTVQYATADGTATVADGDYTAASGTLTFLPGQTTLPVAVSVNGDLKFEPDETFTVNLSAPTNASIATPFGTGTITNDDALPTISINDVSLPEGNSGVTPFQFAVTLSNPSSQTVTVQFSTADGTATIANSDYAAASGTVTFPPGSTSQPLTVGVNGDSVSEPNETFTVNLSAPVNASIADGQGTGTILDDDTAGAPGNSIPTLDTRSLVLFAILLAAAGYLALRRIS